MLMQSPICRAFLLAGFFLHGAASAKADPDSQAAATEAKMSAEQRVVLTHGIMAIQIANTVLPSDAILGAGYVAGIPELGIPALKETDASLGVAYMGGIRKDGATALPSGMAMGATWDPELIRAGGVMIGGEAAAKGFNVLLAGGTNLIRDPRGGRTFEYLSEDPLLSGTLAGAEISGIQSDHVISTVKHFAINDQETARHFVSSKIGDAAARESDLLAFEIAIEQGKPGSVMCAYNQVNGAQACGNDYLLNKVLKHDWAYKGWVMSDWGAVTGLDFALKGLDQQSGAQLDKDVYFAGKLQDAATSDKAYAARLSDMNRRILRSIYDVGVDAFPPVTHAIDFKANGDLSEQVAKNGIVLLRNRGNALPLVDTVKRIAVIGGYANAGVLSGGGSSQVEGEGGPAVKISGGGEGFLADFSARSYQRSSPLKAIKVRLPDAKILLRDGRYVTDAVTAARNADVAIIFATQWMSEGFDVPDLSLPEGQDALIAAVAAANPHTIVVLETGGPVQMPWLDKTAGVIEAWYPGARGAEAIVSVLFGETNPSGRLPVTFPVTLGQLPRPILPGSDTVEPNSDGEGKQSQTLEADYTIEGADVGYRWFAKKGETALFPFGYGLSYTSFAQDELALSGGDTIKARFTVRNFGKRPGADVAQLYLTTVAGAKQSRLVGFKKIFLGPGESRLVEITLDPRLLANWASDHWHVAAGDYGFALGSSAESLGPAVHLSLPDRVIAP